MEICCHVRNEKRITGAGWQKNSAICRKDRCVTNAEEAHMPSHNRGYFSVPSRLDKASLVGLALGHFMMIVDVVQEACYKSASLGTAGL